MRLVGIPLKLVHNQEEVKPKNEKDQWFTDLHTCKINVSISGCEDCQAEYEGDCPVCGPLIVIQDKPVCAGDPQHAAKTIPDMLYIADSSIPGAGSGVFAREPIQKAVRYGPYQGKKVVDEEEAHSSGYSWEVSCLCHRFGHKF